MMINFYKNFYLLLITLLLFLGNCEQDNPDSNTGKQQDTQALEGLQLSGKDLMEASLQGNLEVVRQTADQGLELDEADNLGRTPLMLASFNGHTAVVEFLLDRGADVEKKNSEGRTPLIFAASGPNPETVELLLEWEAEPDVADSVEEWTALMFAAAEGQAQVVQTLLAYGASSNLEDKDGETALDFSRNNGHTEIVKQLEEN